MTDISVTTTASQVENRSWLLSGPEGVGPGWTPSVTLDISKFTAGTHYPNGYIPSGTALAKVTATGLYGPYDSTASDGREIVTGDRNGLLFGSVPVRSGSTKVGGARVIHGVVDETKLPFQSGAGAVSATLKTALRLIFFQS
jgi:hypothetical protein